MSSPFRWPVRSLCWRSGIEYRGGYERAINGPTTGYDSLGRRLDHEGSWLKGRVYAQVGSPVGPLVLGATRSHEDEAANIQDRCDGPWLEIAGEAAAALAAAGILFRAEDPPIRRIFSATRSAFSIRRPPPRLHRCHSCCVGLL